MGKSKIQRKLPLYLMCAIPLLHVFIFSYLPMFGVTIAFKDYRFDKGIFGSEWVGFKNFEFLIKSNDFARITRNTLCLNFTFIIINLICAVSVALLFYYIGRKTLLKAYQTTLIVPHYMSWVVVGYMAYAFLNPQYGFINGTLSKLGLKGIDWYSKPEYWPVILALFSVWKNVGLNAVTYYASLMGIDVSLIEAAKVDGATEFQVSRYIIIPHLRRLMIILTLLAVGGIFRSDFGMFYQLTRDVGALYPTTDVIDTYVYRVMKSVGDMSMSSAVGLLQSFVGFITIVTVNLIVKKIDPESSLF